jgi:hypothetical protein
VSERVAPDSVCVVEKVKKAPQINKKSDELTNASRRPRSV